MKLKLEWSPARLLESITDGISIQDLDMRICYANRAHMDVFGEDIVGRFCYEVYERRTEACDGCPVSECLATGKPATALRVGFNKRGVPWFADIVATPIRNPGGDIVGAVETVRNVTDRKLIEQAADKRHRETAALAKIAMALNTHVNLQDILDVALEQAIDISGAVGGLIRLFDEASGLLVTRTWRTTTNQSISKKILPSQRLGEGAVGAAAANLEVEIINDLSRNSEISGTEHGRGLLELGLNSMVIVPLVRKGQLVGTLALGSFERAKFENADEGLLSAIAGQISISVENARLLEAARAQAKDLAKEVEAKALELAELRKHGINLEKSQD